MQFITDPGIMDIVGLFQLVDNALADVAEGSDVIRKDSYFDAHFSLRFC